MFGGFSGGKKLSALCELNHVDIAPHHDCFIHAHIVAASPSGLIVESFTDPERDPLQAELFENPPKIENGWLYLNDEPGLGLDLSSEALLKFGSKIIVIFIYFTYATLRKLITQLFGCNDIQRFPLFEVINIQGTSI